MFQFIKELFVEHISRISADQLDDYNQRGLIVLSDLISPRTISRARQAMLDEVKPVGKGAQLAFLDDPAILECYTSEVRRAARELAGARSTFRKPRKTSSVTVFPTDVEWQWPSAHIDHALERDAYHTFPLPYRIGCLIYLNDIPRRSGGTVVWPGSHRKIEAMARAQPERYRFLWAVNRDISEIALGEPTEVTGVAGDVLFYHPLCAHAGSLNAGAEPRFALNHKW